MTQTGSDFGRRQGTTREQLRALGGLPPDGYEEISSARQQRRGILIGIGVMVMLAAAYFVSIKGFGRGLDPQLKQYVGLSSADQGPVVKDVLLDQVQSTCKSRKGDANPLDDIARVASYVSCLAAERPKRLCQVAHRVHLLAALKDYYRLRAKSDPRLVEALKVVIVNGYVPRRDLIAAAAQSDLDAALQGVEARQAGCAA